MPKSTYAAFDRRVSAIHKMLYNGATRAEIIGKFLEQWHVSTRQIDTYIARARIELSKISDASNTGLKTAPVKTPHKKRDTRIRDYNRKKILPSAGYVYLIAADTGIHKIGLSINPIKRLDDFSGLPFGVSLVCYIQTGDMHALERRLHKQFAEKRIRNEWFNLSEEDVEYIKSLAMSQQKQKPAVQQPLFKMDS